MRNLKLLESGLIPVYEGENGKKLVDGRELHEFLEVGKDFTTWIKDRISKYGFIENEDYSVTLTKTGERSNVTKHEYTLTSDMAKELSMVENNEKGSQARKYFIAVEKKFKEVAADPYKGLSKELQAVFVLDKKTQEIENRVDDLEANMPLFNVDCKELQALVRKIGTKTLGGYKSPAYRNNSLRGRVYADIQHQLKREFGVNRYEAIKRSQLDTAKIIVEGYKVPLVLETEIEAANNQISFDKEAM